MGRMHLGEEDREGFRPIINSHGHTICKVGLNIFGEVLVADDDGEDRIAIRPNKKEDGISYGHH